jgi:hypothetical protein
MHRNRFSSLAPWCLVLPVITGLLGSMPLAAKAQSAPGKQWAIMIGCEDYTKAAKLQFTVNDVTKLAETLRTHGGMSPDCILQMTDNSDAADQPKRENMLRRLPEWLKKPAAGDSMIVFFSGHGFRDPEGKLYLAPVDIDPANAAATGISAEWLRDQLAACPAKFKLLVLDACHAGSEKGDDDTDAVTAKDLGDMFKRTSGVVTLASSTGEEKSQIWHFKQQSLFSYWLVQGLKGHADDNSDSSVTIDELYDYLHRHVTQTAQARFKRPQTPVRNVGPKIDGVPVVVKLVPQSLKQVITDMSEQLAGTMEERQLGRLGVLEFTTDTKLGEMLGGNFGLLGRYCAEELEKRLLDKSAGKYSVVERRALQDALKGQNFGVKDLFNTVSMQKLAKNTKGGMPVLARGRLIDRAGRIVNLQCKLTETDGDSPVTTVGGVARLNENEWAMLGYSAQVTPEDRRPAAPTIDTVDPVNAPSPEEEHKTKKEQERDQVVNRLDERKDGPHPFQDPKFPFRVKLLVNGQVRPFVFKKVGDRTECFVGVRKGDIYELRVEGAIEHKQCMKLLVDGLNTLPEQLNKGIEQWDWGQRMNLEDARAWVLDPKTALKVKNMPTWDIKGFVTETGQHGKYKEFVIVDADKGLAARQQFTDSIGMITAAFYKAVPKNTPEEAPSSSRSAFSTDAGSEHVADLTENKDLKAGEFLSVVHIKYVDADSLR